MITKILLGGLGVVTLICIFLWFDGQAAKERAATAEAAFGIQKAEADQANKQLTEVVDEYGNREDEIEREIRRGVEYRRRALFAEREYRALSATGDSSAINLRLCKILDSIEGGNSEDREARCSAAGSTSDGAGKIYRIGERYVANLLTNFERCNVLVKHIFEPLKSDVTEAP